MTSPVSRARLHAFLLFLVLWCSGLAFATDAGTRAVVAWNEISLRTTKTGAPAVPAMRNTAMVHIAIHDALNAIAPRHRPFVFRAAASGDAAPVAAIATAAHTVLVALYPKEQEKLDADLAASLALVPDGAAKEVGMAIGKASAQAILGARAGDRMADKVAYTAAPAPGIWRPVPGDGQAPNGAARGPDNAPPLGLAWARMVPLVLDSSDQFRPAPPPAITSDAYARDLRELLEMGGADSAMRSQDQTDAALFWRPTPDLLFNPVVRHFVVDQAFDAWDAARAFALVNVVMVDAVIACWDAKYAYNQWRPITGIREAPAGSHPAIEADRAWGPLLFTPPYPDYPGGHPAATQAAATAMEALFGAEPGQFSVTGSAGKVRQYVRFDAVASEVVDARVWGGVHWRSSDVAGAELGRRVADHILERQR